MSCIKRFRTLVLAIFLLGSAHSQVMSALQLGSRSADEWIEVLESDRRLSGLKIDEVVAELKLAKGSVRHARSRWHHGPVRLDALETAP